MSELPQIVDYRTKIRGLLPANMQTRLLFGLSILMMLIILFSGKQTDRPLKTSNRPEPISVERLPDPDRIKKYQQQLEESTRELTKAEAQLGNQTRASAATVAKATVPSVTPAHVAALPSPEGSPAKDDSLFASNVALSYRPRETSREELPIRAGGASAPTISKQYPFTVPEGTTLDTTLVNRLDSSFTGPVKCMISTAILSEDHQTVLIPEGTFIEGQAQKVERQGDQRLAVVFHRLIRPDHFSIDLNNVPGLSQSGETGLRDQVNHHYLQIFGAALGVGAIAGLAQSRTQYGLQVSGSDAYEQGVAGSLSQSSLHILDRYLNVMPTFTVRAGTRVKVYLSHDIQLPAYVSETSFE